MKEKIWVERILCGEKEASEQFVTTYYAPIYRLLRCLTGREEVALDLAQQTFVKAWQALPGFRHRSRLATWLHRIAYHEYTHWLRDRHEHDALETVQHLAAPETADWLNSLLLTRALEQISSDLRETFLLFHVQELSVAEVAAVLEIAPGTVKSRLFTARQRLRELLQEPADSPPQRLPETVSVPTTLVKEAAPHEISTLQS